MTLRGRLTIAFLAVVLGPLLLGAFFAGGTVAVLNDHRSRERLDLAAATVRTSVTALCQQLYAAADAVAVSAGSAARDAAARQVIARGLAVAVRVTDAAGADTLLTPTAPPAPWAECAGGYPVTGPVRALAVRVDLRDPSGGAIGTVWAAQVVDPGFVARLAAATGAAVTLCRGEPGPSTAMHSTEQTGSRDAVLLAAHHLRGDAVGETDTGRYVRRVGPAPGQPLALVLSVPPNPSQRIYAVLAGAVLLAGLLAVLAAWRLARSTTRPLTELALAVDRVADGDLTARVPVSRPDEVGRLARTFNRMTRETQSYVHALTTSRDQLRNQLALLGDTLASTHDLHRILQVILQTALVATGARAGVLLLLDPGTRTLVGQCGEGLAGPAATDPAVLRIPLGGGLLGTVAATGEPSRGRIGRDGPPRSRFEPDCLTYVAVPFAAPGSAGPPQGSPGVPYPLVEPPAGGALGVLALYDRHGSDDFDDTDLVTLRSFACHAAVAVDNVRMHEEAQRLSLTDPLTGLWNYRYLKESVRREVERASRFGRTISLLVLDLDRFKEVNDTYGHAAGDVVLTEFARRIRGVIREVDLAFRQGGEEFVLLLPETDARGAVTLAERLGAAIRDTPITIPGPAGAVPAGPRALIPVTVSIGIAVYPQHATTAVRMLDAADGALYAAKAAGRDTHRMAAVDDRPVVEEIAVPAGAATPDDGLPRAGGHPGPGDGGASSGPHPPRQVRGR
ncbi:diguanylate cyclase [Micromonospora sp. NPDC050397]|uniref:GGDEF domain-containing protein n=1 Tax=Micromonospora sp. NPDC050397 TaxID=3364279 RepID=UPI00384BE925